MSNQKPEQANDNPAHARTYRIRIDDDHYTTNKQQLSGLEILALASKAPGSFNLRQRLRGGKVETVNPDTIVDLEAPGLERFITIPKENTDGDGELPLVEEVTALRRVFDLPETDTEYLDANHPGWETILEGQTPYLILHNFPVLGGYNHSRVMAAILITSGYPVAHLDMVYFLPHLSRASGRPINALAFQTIDGQSWQRWSRHYSWRAGVDDLATHIERIKFWLENELCK